MTYDTPLDAATARHAPVEVAAEVVGRLRVEHPELDDRALAFLAWQIEHRDDEADQR